MENFITIPKIINTIREPDIGNNDEFKINIKDCLETYPCEHYIIINNVKRIMGSISIVNYLIDNGYEIPEHFNYLYEDDLV